MRTYIHVNYRMNHVSFDVLLKSYALDLIVRSLHRIVALSSLVSCKL